MTLVSLTLRASTWETEHKVTVIAESDAESSDESPMLTLSYRFCSVPTGTAKNPRGSLLSD